LTVCFHHALLLQRLVELLKQAQEMLGVLFLCSFGGDYAPRTRDFWLFLQEILERKDKTSE
jgi:hypothetical protein